MPPASFIAAAAAVSADNNATITVLVPTTAAPGDTLLVVIASTNDGAEAIDSTPTGWAIVATFPSVATDCLVSVCRRITTDNEPSSHTFNMRGGGDDAIGVLLVYRGLDGGVAVAGAAVDVTTTTAFACPSLTLTTYSDLYVGLAFVSSASAPLTPPTGAVERFDGAQSYGTPTELAVFDLRLETVGATGTQTATTAGAQSGMAIALRLATTPALVAPSIVPDVPGAIGFVTVGV